MLRIFICNLYIFLLLVSSTAMAKIEIKDLNSGRVKLTKANFEELLKKAESGEPDSMYMVSLCYYMGQLCSISRDEKKSNFWLEQAAIKGQKNALFNHGMIYQFGQQGKKINLNKAIDYYKKSAAKGYKGARIPLIKALAERRELEDINKINILLKQLIDLDKRKGYTEAVRTYYNASNYESNGNNDDVSNSYFKQFKRWHKASLQANIYDKCGTMGDFYYSNNFVKKDEVMMNAWYQYCKKNGDNSYSLKQRVDDAKFSADMTEKIDKRIKWLEKQFPEVY